MCCGSSTMLLTVLGGVLLLGVGTGAQSADPNTAMAGIYTECVFKFDWSCLQKRTLMFVDRLGRAPEFPLLPWVKLVRTTDEERPLVENTVLPSGDTEEMGDLVDNAVVEFFDEHVIRLEVPVWLRNNGRSYKDHVDLFFGDREDANEPSGPKGEENDLEEVVSGRMLCGGGGGKKCKGGKKGAKKAKKGLKKCLMAVCMVLAGKMMLLAPLMMGLMKLASIKALIMSLISLLMSKGMMMKGKGKGKGMMAVMMNGWQGSGGGGGTGWDSSGGGGGGGGTGGGWQPSGGGGGGGGGGSGPYRRSVFPDRWMGAQELAYNNYSAVKE